ncbi:hypothetical protein [Levilactobacillus brevis]|uniref:hypothetical protein n=1 Tax=Levilactobacillus brevis TaxID=1580 RepID=UPI001C0301E6|nr:hypothetical protein [Levilactobacillus brevis]MBT9677961.1 hypothetical protein [Levilactobacillus brevis]
MEIIDKGSHELVTEYSVGDVIQDDVSVYMIVQTSIDNYAEVDLSNGCVSDSYGSLKELYHETNVSGERKVKAAVVIEGEES